MGFLGIKRINFYLVWLVHLGEIFNWFGNEEAGEFSFLISEGDYYYYFTGLRSFCVIYFSFRYFYLYIYFLERLLLSYLYLY